MGVERSEVAADMQRWSKPFRDQGMTLVGHGLQIDTDDLPSRLTSVGFEFPASEFRPLSETEFFSFDVQVAGMTVSAPRLSFALNEEHKW